MKENKNDSQNLLKSIVWVFKLNFKYVPFITGMRIFSFAYQQASGLIRSFVLALIIDWAIKYTTGSQDEKYIYYSIIAFGSFEFFGGTVRLMRNYSENMVGFQLNYSIPEKILQNKLYSLSIAELENPKIQNIVNRYRENRWVINSMTKTLLQIIGMVVAIILAVGPLVTQIPLVTMLTILSAIPSLFIGKNMINRLWDLDKETTELSRRGGNATWYITTPESLKEVKILNAFSYIKKYFDDYVDLYLGKKDKIYKTWTLLDLGSMLLMSSVILLGIYQLIILASEGEISVGQITFFASALTSVGSMMDNLSVQYAELGGNNSRLNEMLELLNFDANKDSKTKVMEELKNPPEIVIKNVEFKYPNSDKLVLKNLNLNIKPGEKIAIVGENGAGKTTLVKLISGIYPATSGEILINGENLSLVNEESWFQNLGILYQDYNQYSSLTAFENIALGKITDEIDYEKIKDAAKKADAHDFIMDYENNYSQVLSEKFKGGIRPSTGQWQKLAIARFFYRNAPILILDEPTASIDAVAEANIFNRIYEFIENKTVIIISHRFSTVRNADRIIVMDHGEIIEEGTHHELLKKDGKYAKAFKLQAKGYE